MMSTRLLSCVISFMMLTACTPKATTVQTDEEGVRAVLNRYFSTWSARDMEGCSSCFHPQARIFYLAEDGKLSSQGLTDFLHEQRVNHETVPSPMSEKPLDFRIQGDARVAQAVVTWVLNIGPKQIYGTDFFTLQRDGNQWKIVSLVFYGDVKS
jgi:hypothetical protein